VGRHPHRRLPLRAGGVGGLGFAEGSNQVARLPPYAGDLAEIKGQEDVKRAVEVATAAGHNMITVRNPHLPTKRPRPIWRGLLVLAEIRQRLVAKT